jgi:hypothetical protein
MSDPIIKVVCIDETEGGQNGIKLLTNGKSYWTYTGDGIAPDDCYYIIGDDGSPITPLRIYFKPLRESNLDKLLEYE